MAESSANDEVLEQEDRFWQAMKARDADAAAAMTDESCIVVGAQGVSSITPAAMKKMTAEAKWELKKYTLDKKSAQVRFIGDDIAIVGYGVSEDVVYDGKPISLKAFDASVWLRKGDTWVCALHTESVAGDPFGRKEKE